MTSFHTRTVSGDCNSRFPLLRVFGLYIAAGLSVQTRRPLQLTTTLSACHKLQTIETWPVPFPWTENKQHMSIDVGTSEKIMFASLAWQYALAADQLLAPFTYR